jgi:hypothetical protein
MKYSPLAGSPNHQGAHLKEREPLRSVDVPRPPQGKGGILPPEITTTFQNLCKPPLPNAPIPSIDPLDWLMVGLGFDMVRYADDMVVFCHTEEEAKAALEKLREWMADAELTLHPDKTRPVDMNQADSHFDFLGYRFQRSRRGKHGSEGGAGRKPRCYPY